MNWVHLNASCWGSEHRETELFWLTQSRPRNIDISLESKGKAFSFRSLHAANELRNTSVDVMMKVENLISCPYLFLTPSMVKSFFYCALGFYSSFCCWKFCCDLLWNWPFLKTITIWGFVREGFCLYKSKMMVLFFYQMEKYFVFIEMCIHNS